MEVRGIRRCRRCSTIEVFDGKYRRYFVSFLPVFALEDLFAPFDSPVLSPFIAQFIDSHYDAEEKARRGVQ